MIHFIKFSFHFRYFLSCIITHALNVLFCILSNLACTHTVSIEHLCVTVKEKKRLKINHEIGAINKKKRVRKTKYHRNKWHECFLSLMFFLYSAFARPIASTSVSRSGYSLVVFIGLHKYVLAVGIWGMKTIMLRVSFINELSATHHHSDVDSSQHVSIHSEHAVYTPSHRITSDMISHHLRVSIHMDSATKCFKHMYPTQVAFFRFCH